VGFLRVAPRRHEYVDDLPELIHRTVDVPPPTGDLHIGLVHLPAVTDGVPAGASGLGQQRRKPLHPPIDRHVVDLDTTLGEQLLDISVGQAEAQVPADGEHDDVGREAEASKDRSRKRTWASAAASHTSSLAASTRSPGMQQCRLDPPKLLCGPAALAARKPLAVAGRRIQKVHDLGSRSAKLTRGSAGA
jgi:hypothetical protein